MNKIAKTRAPRGFYFDIVPEYRKHWSTGKRILDEVEVKLRRTTNDHKVGSVRLVANYSYRKPWAQPKLETHSHLAYKYHGKGWGTRLYCRAIQWALENGYKVQSSGASSDMALRVWRGATIRKKFRIRVRHYKGHDGNILDTCDMFYAFPK